MEINKNTALMQSVIGMENVEFPVPYNRWLNPVILKAEYGNLVYRYKVRGDMLNIMKTLHGGVSAGIIDDLCGATTFTLSDDHVYTTLNNYIDYFGSAVEGDTIIAETHVIKAGRQFVNVICEIWNEDRSRLLVKGTSNLFKLPKKA